MPDETRTPITEVYDPSTDIWTILAPMPTSRQEFQTEVIDEKYMPLEDIVARWERIIFPVWIHFQ
ncbi:Kelch repeat-containing protein [Anaerotignum propionicum]|uniref:Kelch repeat-containing protein n=1 Tax=Anaerotignum propionicum TaxID=28446 RepID=UPI003AB9B304